MARSPRNAVILLLLWCGLGAACSAQSRTGYPSPPPGISDAGTIPESDGGQADLPRQSAPAPHRHVLLPGDRIAFAKAVEQSLAATRRFAESSRHEAAVAAAAVIAALGHAIETMPDPTNSARDKIAEVRFEAERLRRSDRLSFSIPKWMKLGLSAALDALDILTPPDDTRSFWIAMARQTNDAIDVGSTATFQRARLQDALRTTVTAFVIVGQGLGVCDSDVTSSPRVDRGGG
jgi:hypothetical protein